VQVAAWLPIVVAQQTRAFILPDYGQGGSPIGRTRALVEEVMRANPNC
jgi:hypothetical protein